ncbi:MAG: hypothetical protein R2881_02390 [Eubacteriales bacterium]
MPRNPARTCSITRRSTSRWIASYLQALFALNRVYFPSRKRSLEFIPRLRSNRRIARRGWGRLLRWEQARKR